MRTDVATPSRGRRVSGRPGADRDVAPHSLLAVPAAYSAQPPAGSPDRSTMRLLVVLVIVLSAVCAFAVGGLVAVASHRTNAAPSGGSAAASAIGRLAAGPDVTPVTAPAPARTAAAATPQEPAGAVKHPASTPGPTTPAPVHSCSATPNTAADTAGLPIPIFTLC
ncbi:hypothetical protein [Frankia sp. AgB32]|uniref:hypothetical protein n=1 Tax=Frankia sp. AgB32 TaxID=631119 RepID=UPI0020100907|nr:hypothetical protein [Frankia sp. AgB32]MCK9893004.1 hypothetical protein [Frankia sp. AgB32]